MIQRIKTYISETRVELKKVTWPSRQDLIDSTRVVIIATLIMTVFVGFIDQVLSRIIKLVFG
jgi:preprotein translocase subunit SecE